MVALYSLTLFLLSLYSYVLVDPNLTLVNSQLWEQFRNLAVSVGYYQRNTSVVIYLVITGLLFVFHILLLRNFKRVNAIKIAIITGAILLLSYPFLSHDFFNYLFDAKILTFYHQNPYLHKALDFPQDPWLRFMHWTHRTYPYGPSFLLVTLIPSFLAFGKFILSFIFFKLTFFAFYFFGVYYLNNLNKKWALIFATHPLVLIEGLVNGHNDLIALSLAIFGIFFVFKKNYLGRIFLILSATTKYITVPLLIVSKNSKKWNLTAMLLLIGVFVYLSFWQEVQSWYFLSIFAFLPFYEKFITKINIFLWGLLVSYYPFIAFGDWTKNTVNLKHQIIFFAFILNLLLFLKYNLADGKVFTKLKGKNI